MTAGGEGKNPFNDPLYGLYGDLDELMASLSDDEILELCRYWNWWRQTAVRGLDRWGYSKLMSGAKRELDRRGVDRDSWLD